MEATEEGFYNKREELISKFKDGDKRYLESSLFNSVIHSLALGTDPLEIIDQLITVTEDTKKTLEDCLKSK